MDLEALGGVLRERRREAGMSRAELARRIGVTPTYVWLVEGAKPRKHGAPSRPGEAVLGKWVRALNMDADQAARVFALAGYGALFGAAAVAVAGSGAPAAGAPRVMRMAMMAQPDTGSGTEASPALFASTRMPPAPTAAAFAAESSAEAEAEEALTVELRQLLSLAGPHSGKRQDTLELLRSVFDWLRFRLDNERMNGEVVASPSPPAPLPPGERGD